MKFINFTVVKFSVLLVLGILTAYFLPITTFLLNYLLLLLLGVYGLWLWARKQLIQNIYFGVATYLCFFAIGYFSYQMRMPQFQPNHYTRITSENTPTLLQLKIAQTLKPDKYNLKYFTTVNAINGVPTNGKILLNISKDSLTKFVFPDEMLLVYTPILEISKPLNPHQFDYSSYLKSLGVYNQLRISENDILKTKKGSKTLKGIAQNLRAGIIEKLQNTKLKTDERAIIQALVLGEKKDIDKNLYDEYAAAGAVHILAVSGLHVGILYIILAFLFKPLLRWKYGVFFQAILIVLLLWGFALLSGLSPSVTRAVTMFSFFALAKLFNRESNSINTLFLSFLTLLIINPLWLFQVGFQLSYLAVFFIVWLQPLFYKIGYSKYWVLRKVWAIVSVTICAQIGVFPLSLYYFHQFPGLFLLTNIVVLPFLTVLMCGGILIVVLTSLNSLPDWFAEMYNFLIEGLNGFIHWVATQDEYLFQNIHFSTLKVLGAYLLIVALALFFTKMNYQRLVSSLLAFSVLITIYIYDELSTSTNQLVVFQRSKQTLIGYKSRQHFMVFKNDSTKNISDTYPIKSFITAVNINTYSEEELPKLFRYKDKNILVLDSLGIFPNHQITHTLLLTNSPKINLNRIIDSLKPKQIIADGSNYFTYVKRWEKTCKLKKLPFCHTAKQGAFPIE
ncbi:ComEC/Rec2 family competence protein [Aequorivita lipolytica]|uniref:ComEC family competence protein n=1 Tax=Aequorivita lipolytica TaxID=153267 RepID=A0A5C6YVF4_9FLAO|nr:ComEC/Rec2 family competence protein [Aequorivita lipolytica]TXD70945.1 ComEC family competence protein [Aequorivita lipolytica]SRX49998.1 ComE operon protein 3 [Aequorivita lipolytica]